MFAALKAVTQYRPPPLRSPLAPVRAWAVSPASMNSGEASLEGRCIDSSFPRAGSKTAVTASPSERPCVLIVEDEPTLCKMLAAALADEYEVEMVSDELAAYTSVQRRVIALVIVDVHPPGTSGLSLIHRLRKDARARNVPVVMLTASEHRKMMLQCLAAGANNFLLKPFGIADLRACVRSELALADAASRARA